MLSTAALTAWVLVVGRDLLHHLDADDAGLGVFFLAFLEDDEVPHEIEQNLGLEHPDDQRFELADERRRLGLAVGGLPRHEPRERGGERSHLGVEAVGDDEQCVVAKQRRDRGLVGFKLVIRRAERRFFVGGVLQLDDGEGKSVDEQHEVGAFVLAVLDHSELVNDDEVVVLGVLEIDEPDEVAARVAVLVGDVDAFGEESMERFVAGEQFGGAEALDLLDRFGAGGGGNLGLRRSTAAWSRGSRRTSSRPRRCGVGPSAARSGPYW